MTGRCRAAVRSVGCRMGREPSRRQGRRCHLHKPDQPAFAAAVRRVPSSRRAGAVPADRLQGRGGVVGHDTRGRRGRPDTVVRRSEARPLPQRRPPHRRRKTSAFPVDRRQLSRRRPGRPAAVGGVPRRTAIPRPDRVLYMADQPFDVPAQGELPYQYYEVDPGFTEDQYVRAVEVRPGDASVVTVLGNPLPPSRASSFRQPRCSPHYARYGADRDAAEGGVAHRRRILFQMPYTPNGSPRQDRTLPRPGVRRSQKR